MWQIDSLLNGVHLRRGLVCRIRLRKLCLLMEGAENWLVKNRGEGVESAASRDWHWEGASLLLVDSQRGLTRGLTWPHDWGNLWRLVVRLVLNHGVVQRYVSHSSLATLRPLALAVVRALLAGRYDNALTQVYGKVRFWSLYEPIGVNLRLRVSIFVPLVLI